MSISGGLQSQLYCRLEVHSVLMMGQIEYNLLFDFSLFYSYLYQVQIISMH